MQLNEKETKLFDLLMAMPPDLDAVESFLRSEELSPSEVTRVANEYVEECYCDATEYASECTAPLEPQVIPNLHSTYLYDIIKLLLQFGLEPNGTYDDNNIMLSLIYIHNEFIAADTLALLLEHGGNPHLSYEYCMDLFMESDYDVFFEAVEWENRQAFASHVHYWMVLIGYGARYPKDFIEVFKENDDACLSKSFNLQKLRNHRKDRKFVRDDYTDVCSSVWRMLYTN